MNDRLLYKFGKLDRKMLIRIIIGLLVAICISVVSIQPVNSQGVKIYFGETKTENHFPTGIRFSVKIDVTDERGTVDFNYKLGNESWSREAAKCSPKMIVAEVDYYSCIFFLDIPNTPPQLPVTYKWRLYGTAERYSEEQTVNYENPCYLWQTFTKGNVTIWWHDRPQEFAERVYSIAEKSIQQQHSLFEVDLANPIHLVVENSREENSMWNSRISYSIGGQAFPAIGVTIQIVELNISDARMDYWLKEVVPHEISHLYFFQATNREQAKPPNWLDEGLAGYNEFNSHRFDWVLIKDAIRQNKLVPLANLRDEFKGNDEQVALAYAESMTAAEYLIDTYGKQGLNNLFSSYQEGKTSDEAFQLAFGRTVSEVETDWEAWAREKPDNFDIGVLISLFFVGAYFAGGCISAVLLVGLIIFLSRKKTNSENFGWNRTKLEMRR